MFFRIEEVFEIYVYKKKYTTTPKSHNNILGGGGCAVKNRDSANDALSTEDFITIHNTNILQ